MVRRLKYRLLIWLMNDLCSKSKCNTCEMSTDLLTCEQNSIFVQARRVWGLEPKDEKEERTNG